MTEQTDAFVLQPHTGSRFRREFGRGARSMVAAKWPILALLILLVVLVVAIFGPAIAPMDPNRLTLRVYPYYLGVSRLLQSLSEGVVVEREATK